MALFFDAQWFDARLGESGAERGALADAAGMSADDLTLVFNNQREPTGAEIRAFAHFIGSDLIETSVHCGIAGIRAAPEGADTGARLDYLDARLDAIDSWLEDFERETRKTARGR